MFLLALGNAESLGLGLRRLVPLHLRGVGPQTFQPVVLTGSGLEEVDDDVAVIEEDPFGLRFAFVAQRFQVEVFAETFFDAFGEGLDMRSGGPGCDNEHIGQNKEVFDIKQDDVIAFLGEDGICGSSSQVFTSLFDGSLLSNDLPHHIACFGLRVQIIGGYVVDDAFRHQETERSPLPCHCSNHGATYVESGHLES